MSKKFYGSLLVSATLLMASQQAAMAANLVVAQIDLPAGQSITVGGVKYQIIQYEVPAFDSDKIYIVKFPVSADTSTPSSNSYSSFVSVYGSTTPQPPHLSNTINVSGTGLSGFKAFYEEGYNFNAYGYGTLTSSSALTNQLTLSNTVGIQLDAKTYVSLNLANKITTQRVNSTTFLSDTTTKLKAAPVASTKALRNRFLLDSRTLFKYVSIKEKL